MQHEGRSADGAEPCTCGHDSYRTPPADRRQALDYVRHWFAIELSLTVVARDASRWLGVLHCTHCGRYWAEDSMPSGHAELFFGYAIITTDPHGWLAHATPLRLSP